MRITECRICDSRRLEMLLDLGETALANSFVRPDRILDAEATYPLRLVLCSDCGLVQIDEDVPAKDLYRNYIYVSGTSDWVFRHAEWLAEDFLSRYQSDRNGLIVEVASNDGTVLKAFQRRGIRTLGVEPAENIAAVANLDGVDTVCEFFDVNVAERVRRTYGPATLILGRHVLAHAEDLHGFVAALRILLDDGGVAAIEVPHLLQFYNRLEYDTVYHEHRCYFSLSVLKTLFEAHDLRLVNVQEFAIHGGSIVVTVQRVGGPHLPSAAVPEMLEKEQQTGLHRIESWRTFAAQVAESKQALLAELDHLKAMGHQVVGYGAAAKSNTLLAYCGIGQERLSFIVDKSPHKQGLLTPGHHIPVFAAENLLEDQPDIVLILAWNFFQEIIEQQAEYARRGGKFLLPLPRVQHWDERVRKAA